MGKVRGLRARVHQAAVRPAGSAAPPAREAALPVAAASGAGAQVSAPPGARLLPVPRRPHTFSPLQAWASVSTDIFAGTKIEPGALIQRLELDTQSVVSLGRGIARVDLRLGHPTGTGTQPKAVLPKKEKLRLRRARWLQKIEALELAQRALRAERQRRATVVVGDLQPLRDALPELLQLEPGTRRPRTQG
ncbi:Protein FAM207A [Galemys pyrenaicus]|uniref:Protein FAM207A n=1 Tax=Galemys pyrenaicus TaxID=202257 RepID=A0A8J6DEP5_GALPY|nr:Protein FAM207A [Galemys pyrenaicus]